MAAFSFDLPNPPIRNLVLQKKLTRGICLLCLLAFGYQVRGLTPGVLSVVWIRTLSGGCFLLAALNGILLLIPRKTAFTRPLAGRVTGNLTLAWLALLAMTDFLLGFGGMGLLLVLLIAGLVTQARVEQRASRPRKVSVDSLGIHLPGAFYPQLHRWKEMNRILLVHGLLTLDLKSNRVIQMELSEDPDPGILREFDEFCQGMLQDRARSTS
ncbi:MAG TPA: hypothetical protein VMV20_01775 [Chitinophagaceae bacterium]|nr:hypothetical protein [Chitinophagaceae bacterium]